MNYFRFFFVLLTLSLFGSACSTHPPFDRVENEKTDLVDTFNLNEAGFEKFKVTTPSPSPTPAVNTAAASVTTAPAEMILPQKGTKKRKKFQKESLTKAPTSSGLSPAVPPIVSVDQQPKDYPEAIKNYDSIYRKYWENYKPMINVGEQFIFKASYLGVTAGFIEMTTMDDASVAGKDVFHISGHLTSAEYYRYVYTVDDRIDTFIDKKTFTPLKYTLIQRESGQKVDDLQLFDRDNYKSHFWYKRVKKDATKTDQKSEYIPRFFQDSFSALHFIRGFPLKIGDYYEFPVYTRGKIWVLKLWVEGEEEVSTNGKNYKALRIRAQTHFPGVLKANDDIFFWFSFDADKIPLKFKAKVKIGSIAGDLVKYTPGRK